MAQALMKLTTAAGSSLAVAPRAGKSATAVGVFLPREGQDQLLPLPTYDEAFAESANSEGGPRVQSAPKNAVGQGSVLVVGDDAQSFREWHQRWQQFVEAMRREGGTLEYRPPEGVSVTYEVLSMKITTAPYDGLKIQGYVQELGFEVTCRPYGLLAAEEQTLRDHDPFSRDTISAGEWATFDEGAGLMEISEEKLKTTSTAGKRMHRYGIKVSNAAGTIKTTTGANVGSGNTSIVMKRQSASEALWGRVQWVGNFSVLRVTRLVGGVETVIAESPTFKATANTAYWLKFTMTGNVATVELFTADPDEGAAPMLSLATTLAGENATKFGEGIWGNAGLKMNTTGTDFTWDEWRLDSKAFRATSPMVDLELPGVQGHVDALGELAVTDIAQQSRRMAEYGLERAGEYNPAEAPPNIIDSDQLVTSGFSGAQASRTGAYDPLASGNNCVRAGLAVMPVAVCGTGIQRYVGPYRAKVRVHLDPRNGEAANGVGPAYVRFAAAASPGGPFTRGEWVRVPANEAWCLLDLGITEPTPAAVPGAIGWEVRVEAMTENAGDTIDVDFVEMLGAGKYGKSKGSTLLDVPAILTIQDQFNQTPSGALNGKAIGSASNEAPSKSPTAQGNGEEERAPWSATGATGAPDGTTSSTFLEVASVENSVSKALILYKNLFSIPESATIRGIKVEVMKMAPTGGTEVVDNEVRLSTVKAGRTNEQGGSNKASASAWPKSLAMTTYGGESDLWGRSWTPAQLNSEGFSFWIRAQAKSGNGAVYVDGIVVTIYYTPAGSVTWSEAGGTASTSAIQLEATGHIAQRVNNAVPDAVGKGRFATAGTAAGQKLKSAVVQAEVMANAGGPWAAVMTRYVSQGQYLAAGIQAATTGGNYNLIVRKQTSTTPTFVYYVSSLRLSKITSQWLTIRLQVEADGRWYVWVDGVMQASGFDKGLSEGTWAEGLSGIYTESGANATAVNWDGFGLWSPELKAAMYAGRQVRFRSRDAIRENENGTWSPAPGYEGARLRIPPAGPSGQTSRLAVQARRANTDESVDEWIADETQVGLSLRPRVVLLG